MVEAGCFSGEPLSDDFHVYRVDIDPEHISWFVDDQHYLTVSSGDIPVQHLGP